VKLRLLVLLCALPFVPPWAYGQAGNGGGDDVQVTIGESSIRLPIPSGFADSSTNPEMLAIGQVLTPRHRRLLAFFVSQRSSPAAGCARKMTFESTQTMRRRGSPVSTQPIDERGI